MRLTGFSTYPIEAHLATKPSALALGQRSLSIVLRTLVGMPRMRRIAPRRPNFAESADMAPIALRRV
jgi:hypothetical protein